MEIIKLSVPAFEQIDFPLLPERARSTATNVLDVQNLHCSSMSLSHVLFQICILSACSPVEFTMFFACWTPTDSGLSTGCDFVTAGVLTPCIT